jgi:hypothetical protein
VALAVGWMSHLGFETHGELPHCGIVSYASGGRPSRRRLPNGSPAIQL